VPELQDFFLNYIFFLTYRMLPELQDFFPELYDFFLNYRICPDLHDYALIIRHIYMDSVIIGLPKIEIADAYTTYKEIDS
jgi:hypothetical protein